MLLTEEVDQVIEEYQVRTKSRFIVFKKNAQFGAKGSLCKNYYA